MTDSAVLISLSTSALLMGVAGVPHCAGMCVAPCAAAMPGGLSWPVVIGRTLGYAILGALAAHMTGWVTSWAVWAGKLQSIWLMALFATAVLGAWMLVRGVLPQWMTRSSEALHRRIQGRASPVSVLYGMAWAALPCGLLYSAVVVAALAPQAWQGALVMVAFSLPGGLLLKWLPRWWQQQWHQAAMGRSSAWLTHLANPQWAVRISGGMLASVALWALSHRLQEQWQAWCA